MIGESILLPTGCAAMHDINILEIEEEMDDGENGHVVRLIEQKLNKMSLVRRSDFIISRIPPILFNGNPEAYIPQMVSIGPFHHDKHHLQSMESFKIDYFKKFLNRRSSLEDYVKAMTNLVERAYQCYPDVKIERKNFVMMMVVDGGFILELLLIMKYCEYDKVPNFNLIHCAFFDLILGENQLPFFVLEELYQIFIGDSREKPDLKDLICQTWIPCITELLFGKIRINISSSGGIAQTNYFSTQIPQNQGKPKHLLDLLRKFIIPPSSSLAATASIPPQPLLKIDEYTSVEPMRCATELKNANIKFEKNKNPTSLLDIKFNIHNGILTIPPLIVHDETELLFRNLIAYEIICNNDYNYIIEYIHFIRSLINSSKDVELLKGISPASPSVLQIQLLQKSDTEKEEMDDGKAMYADMQEIVGGDIMFPMAHSHDTEKEQEDAELVGVLEQKLNKVPPQPSDCSIYRVPKMLLEENLAAYTPHMVSIGPFHHDQQHLQHMEAYKMQYLKDFLARSSPGKLKDYVKAMTDLVERAYQCYLELDIERKSFVMMMTVDGCFILELLLREPNTESDAKFSSLVLVDLILLENQLPFFVLEALYQVFIEDFDHDAADKHTVSDLICENYVPQILKLLLGEDTISSSRDIEETEPNHLLDLVRQFLIPLPMHMASNGDNSEHKIVASNGDNSEHKIVGRTSSRLNFAPAYNRRFCLWDHLDKDNVGVRFRCATDLEKGNLEFKRNENPTSLLDIRFTNGVLTIPGITCHSTEVILRNLIAYELFSDDYSYVTEYAAFLDGLIDTHKDVELLQMNGIVETIFGDPKAVARLFNNLLKHTAIPLYYTFPVLRDMEQYYNRPWHRWKASLMFDYFNTPWSLMSVFVAIILLIMTFIQTYYTALPFVKYNE
ncbi:hypothetical protein NE237_024480 [Protea cynaroides]|uniref:Uncharacterized protein n=1 Tax=Protea cynaroides TaxID=273540 RepID=A0A9Q0H586_9MAGN|nr:hypothetical protein NE237_024480 [Protea cynaroides]